MPVHLLSTASVLIREASKSVYSRFVAEGSIIELARQRIRERPQDVGPLLGAADVHLATGQLSQAIRKNRSQLSGERAKIDRLERDLASLQDDIGRVEKQAAAGKSVAALESERDRLEEEYRLLLDLYVDLAQ